MRRLSLVDSLFLNIESWDTPMHVGGVAVLELAGNDPDTAFLSLRKQVYSRLSELPILRQRPVEFRCRLTPPCWIEDPDFALDHHIVPLCLLPSAGHQSLAGLTGLLIQKPMIRQRPLWMLYYVENVGHSQAACIMVIHHAYLDGVSAGRLLEMLLDKRADGNREKSKVHQAASESTGAVCDNGARYASLRQVRPTRLIQKAASAAIRGGVAAFPKNEEVLRSLWRHSAPFVAPQTRFNSPIDSRRSYGYCGLSMEEITCCKTALGVTVNDVILNICAGALREYLLSKGELPDKPLIAAIPFSTRRGVIRARQWGNFVMLFRISLDLSIADPVVRQRAISSSTTRLRDRYRLFPDELWQAYAGTVFAAVAIPGSSVYKKFSKHFGVPFNLIISSIRGPTSQLSLSGLPVIAAYPISVPYHGLAMNITAFSYHDQINIGITAWEGAMSDAEDFAMLVEESFNAISLRVKATLRSSRQLASERRR